MTMFRFASQRQTSFIAPGRRNIAALLGALVFCAWPSFGFAQISPEPKASGPGFDISTTPVPPPGPMADKMRPFTGYWQNIKPLVGMMRPGVAPLTPAYNARLEELVKIAVAGGEVVGNEPKCIPNGPVMNMGFGFRAFADATQMGIVTAGPRVRYVWLDGRKHTPDDYLFETYDGESVAKWDGNTLVIDTIGLKATDEIVFGIPVNDTKMHLVERWKMLSPSSLEIQTTIEDPVALTKPWSYRRVYARQSLTADTMYCVAASDRARDGEYDLTPPAEGYVPPGAK